MAGRGRGGACLPSGLGHHADAQLLGAGAGRDSASARTGCTATRRVFLPEARWKVLSDMHLGLFSFGKYIMYRDLAGNLRYASPGL